ncbi:MAG: caspase family protein [Candidatus Bipolaricaulota bacterium]
MDQRGWREMRFLGSRPAAKRAALAATAAFSLLLGGCMFLFLNESPVAWFEATPREGNAPLDVTFDGRSSYDPDGQLVGGRWSFGDGESATGFLVAHTYTAPGRYVVSFEVEDDEGASGAATEEIVVRGSTNYAILVGIARYYRMPPLSYSDDDAVAMAALLAGAAEWDEERIALLLDGDATAASLRQALASLEAASAEDTLVFFYSGHGAQRPERWPGDEADAMDEALCLFDADLLDDELAALLAAVPMRRIVVFLDACYSGGQLDSLGEADSLPDLDFLTDLARAAALAPKDLDGTGKEIVALSASHRDEPSWEFGSLGHGVFTYALLEAMRGGADASGNRNGWTSAEECHRYLEPRVAELVAMHGGFQHPQMLDMHPGELEFVSSP